MRLLIIGHARHGKDTVAEFLNEFYGYTFKSSSVAASEIFLYDALKAKYDYMDPIECFEDRVNHRQEWHDLICEYNKEDKVRLAKGILATSDMYVGMRSNAEVEECLAQGLFDLIIGVYDPRKPLEPSTSFDIDIWSKADIVVPNGGTLEQLRTRVADLAPLLTMRRSTVINQFADQMQIELTKNKHKGSILTWNGIKDKIADLEYHKAKMIIALRSGQHASVKEYIADCANILLAIGYEGGLYNEQSQYTDNCSELVDEPFKMVSVDKKKVHQSLSKKYLNK